MDPEEPASTGLLGPTELLAARERQAAQVAQRARNPVLVVRGDPARSSAGKEEVEARPVTLAVAELPVLVRRRVREEPEALQARIQEATDPSEGGAARAEHKVRAVFRTAFLGGSTFRLVGKPGGAEFPAAVVAVVVVVAVRLAFSLARRVQGTGAVAAGQEVMAAAVVREEEAAEARSASTSTTLLMW